MNSINKIVMKLTCQVNNDIEDFIVSSVQEYGMNQTVVVNAKKIYEALEKQVPKKPVKKSFIVPYEGINVCPSCKEPLGGKKHYCCECGQKLDWSD